MKATPPLLPPLDDAPGPSVARAPDELDALRDQIIVRAARRAPRLAARAAWSRSGITPALRGGASFSFRLAAALGLIFVSVGTGVAAVRRWPALSAYFAPDNRRVQASSPARAAKALTERQAAPELEARDSNPPPVSAAVRAREAVPVAATAVSGTARASTDLLARANQLRAQQRWRAAEAAYLQALATATSSAARSAAAVAAADLQLNQLHQPRAALALFERALRLEPAGVLAEQARRGLAQCRRALGERSAPSLPAGATR